MPDIAEAQRLPAGLELGSIYFWTALSDGSVLLVDFNNRKAFRVAAGRKRQELPLVSEPFLLAHHVCGRSGGIDLVVRSPVEGDPHSHGGRR